MGERVDKKGCDRWTLQLAFQKKLEYCQMKSYITPKYHQGNAKKASLHKV